MKAVVQFAIFASSFLIVSCATPLISDASKVDLNCAQQCSANLATCSSGFKLFPVIVQQQCNDNYDVCIQACPEKVSTSDKTTKKNTAERLKELDDLFNTGLISKDEYDQKRTAIINSL